jgi:prepilin-type processing-associated H-X9-DG protein
MNELYALISINIFRGANISYCDASVGQTSMAKT